MNIEFSAGDVFFFMTYIALLVFTIATGAFVFGMFVFSLFKRNWKIFIRYKKIAYIFLFFLGLDILLVVGVLFFSVQVW